MGLVGRDVGLLDHGDAVFHAKTFTEQAKDVKSRPAMVVVYEP